MATATATTSDSSSSSVRWNIVETHTLEKRKTRDGRKLLNNYELHHTLGRGQFAKVKLCERLSAADITAADTEAPGSAANELGSPPPPPQPTVGGSAHEPPAARRQFALKCFSKKALERMKEYTTEPPADGNGSSNTRLRVVTALDHVRDEIAIMRSLYHRNVVLLFEVIESDASDDLYLVLELLPRGPCMVFDPKTRRFTSPLTDGAALPDAWVKAHVRDVLSGLAYLHARGICHRDLKPGNVLLSASGRCRLSDFGCARAFAETNRSRNHVRVSDTVGTYQFLAPECCSGDPYDPFQVDVWATGMLLYVFLYSVLPFTAETTRELFDEITNWDVETHPPPPTGADGSHREVSAECRDLLCRLLARDPSARLSVADALQHAWLAEDDADDEPLSF